MRFPSTLASILVCLAGGAIPSAPSTSSEPPRITTGHHHLLVTDFDAHRKFWIGLLGATPSKLGDMEVLVFPQILIFLRQGPPSGGTQGTTVDHIGLQVKELSPLVEKLKAAGVPIITREVLSSRQAEGDIAYLESEDAYVAFVLGPDEIKVELTENRALQAPVANHHIHFSTEQVDEMKAWYVKVFGAVPTKRGGMEAADLPGVDLIFSPARAPVVGTQGRVLDHIGFEVENLRSFCEKLESMGIEFDTPYFTRPEVDVSLAFFTDPWGTYIEIHEGLDRMLKDR